jgi:hypothetical protein
MAEPAPTLADIAREFVTGWNANPDTRRPASPRCSGARGRPVTAAPSRDAHTATTVRPPAVIATSDTKLVHTARCDSR